jgi:3-oxoacyl-[acyl-carrier protein] reductase
MSVTASTSAKIAIVTGGSRGIGAACALRLAEHGFTVCVNFLTNESKASEIAEAIGGIAYKADVGDFTAVQKMVETVAQKYGRIDLLVNNAGVSGFGLFQEMRQQSNEIYHVNLHGTLNCTRAVLKYMLPQKSGCIVNISSVWGETGSSCEVDYSVAKAGIIGLTKALAKEVAPSKIRVNCVCPGVIDTDMNKSIPHADLATLVEEIPLGRLGTAGDVANAVVFLANEKASYITGQTLSVNGGFFI